MSGDVQARPPQRAPGGARAFAKGTARKGATPVMQQFLRAKAGHPDAVVFFRLGDFYEMFYEDAVRAAELLDITLTARGQDKSGERIPMAGVPHHAAASYIAKLLDKGCKVAICEQMAEPSKTKGIVPREVVRVVTPGLCVDPDALDACADNFLVCVVGDESHSFGLAAYDVSTGQLRSCSTDGEALLVAEVARLEPREVLLGAHSEQLEPSLQRIVPRAVFQRVEPLGKGELAEQLDRTLEGGDRERVERCSSVAKQACAAALRYASDSLGSEPLRVAHFVLYDPGQNLLLDEAALRNLELVRTLRGERKGSLLHLLDRTRTAMGARLLRDRLLCPLADVAAIRRRHDAVEAFVQDAPRRQALRELLGRIGDVERWTTRAVMSLSSPRELGAIRNSLAAAGEIQRLLGRPATGDMLGLSEEQVLPEDCCGELLEHLQRVLVDEPPNQLGHGPTLRTGANEQLDSLRGLSARSKDLILELEQRERARTGIQSLKVRYTKVFGYYIEVTRSNLHAVPEDYRRKQTVAGGERFVTDELSDLQEQIDSADDRAHRLEEELFQELRSRVAEQATSLRVLAKRIAMLDVHASFAEVAHRHGYTRPEVDDSLTLQLVESRHPVVEQLAAAGDFVPNDVELDVEGERLAIITGPNMAGKSTVMRQVALAVLMAQAGGFVPARRAHIGVVDRIFTRVGASDNVSGGQSTFMVEMKESATILAQATKRSLVVVDEVGRGTSTYDGVAIAWAVAEHIHDTLQCRAMFATHYHELCDLAEQRRGVANFNVAAREYRDEVVFLHRLVRGPSNRSYGIAVARLAGVTPSVLDRAQELLHGLEGGQRHAAPGATPAVSEKQLGLFAGGQDPGIPDPHREVIERLEEVDLERMTPIEALVYLERLKAELQQA